VHLRKSQSSKGEKILPLWCQSEFGRCTRKKESPWCERGRQGWGFGVTWYNGVINYSPPVGGSGRQKNPVFEVLAKIQRKTNKPNETSNLQVKRALARGMGFDWITRRGREETYLKLGGKTAGFRKKVGSNNRKKAECILDHPKPGGFGGC